MNRSTLLIYQCLTGMSDTVAGAALCVAPLFTLGLMRVHAPSGVAPWAGYIGAFVLSVGLAGLYGVYLVAVCAAVERIETVWLLTAFSRSAVAVYLLKGILTGEIEPAWLGIAMFDAACVVVQGIGLRKRWLAHAQ